MLHTKTKPGTYDEHDYWVVSFTLIERATGKREHVEKTYRDVDYAYEDYLYYNNKVYYDADHWITGCKYNHYRDDA